MSVPAPAEPIPRAAAEGADLLIEIAAGRVTPAAATWWPRAAWDEALTRAERHGLWPRVARLYPGPLRPADAEARDLQALRSTLMARRLADVTRALDEAGVASLAYKGPALAHLIDGDVTLRASADLDLVVRPEQVGPALAVLTDLGFRPLTPGAPPPAAVYHLEVVDPAGIPLELHWALAGWNHPLGLAFDDLLARARLVPLSGHDVWTFGPEDLVLVLAFHAAKHGLRNLGWLADLARLPLAELDGATLLRRAAAAGARRALLAALGLTDELFGVELPEPLPAAIAASGVRPLVTSHARELREDGASVPRANVRRSFALMDGPAARLRLLAWWLLPDRRHLLAYPRAWRPVARLVHPFRQLGRSLARRPTRPC